MVYLALLCGAVVALPRAAAAVPLFLGALLALRVIMDPGMLLDGPTSTMGPGPWVALVACLVAVAVVLVLSNMVRLPEPEG